MGRCDVGLCERRPNRAQKQEPHACPLHVAMAGREKGRAAANAINARIVLGIASIAAITCVSFE